MLISGGLHGALFYGMGPEEPAPIAVVAEENYIELMEMPNLKDLEEPEPEEFSDGGEAPDQEAVSYVPMLADLPSSVTVDSFVQKLDLSMLNVKPDFSTAKVVTIPPGARRAGPAAGEGLKNVFNLADLDRIPEPVLQPAPVFPSHLRREIAQARVDVEFIVNTSGKVVDARVVYATVSGFEDAAIHGVKRWQFRPGMKGGKRVNTRMRVPIVFRVVDAE
jgi:protein TonB